MFAPEHVHVLHMLQIIINKHEMNKCLEFCDFFFFFVCLFCIHVAFTILCKLLYWKNTIKTLIAENCNY